MAGLELKAKPATVSEIVFHLGLKVDAEILDRDTDAEARSKGLVGVYVTAGSRDGESSDIADRFQFRLLVVVERPTINLEELKRLPPES